MEGRDHQKARKHFSVEEIYVRDRGTHSGLNGVQMQASSHPLL